MVKTRGNDERTEGEVTGRREPAPEGKRAVSIRRGKLLFFPTRRTKRSEKEGKAPASEREVSSSSGPDEA